jgi:hypothetical protein
VAFFLRAALVDINIGKDSFVYYCEDNHTAGAILVLKFLRHFLKVITTPNQTYRKAKGGSVWHFSTRCKFWPLRNFEETNDSPQFGVCPDCTRIEQDTKTPSYIP